MTEGERMDELGDMRVRLERLEAIEAVRLLKATYWSSLDRCAFDAVRACFAEDAVIEMEGVPPVDGPDAYVAFCRQANSATDTMNLHAGQNPRIVVIDAAHATGTWDQWFAGLSIDVDGKATLMRLTGVYHDEYVRRDGRWLIAAMRFRQTSFVMGPPTTGAIVAANSGAAFG